MKQLSIGAGLFVGMAAVVFFFQQNEKRPAPVLTGQVVCGDCADPAQWNATCCGACSAGNPNRPPDCPTSCVGLGASCGAIACCSNGTVTGGSNFCCPGLTCTGTCQPAVGPGSSSVSTGGGSTGSTGGGSTGSTGSTGSSGGGGSSAAPGSSAPASSASSACTTNAQCGSQICTGCQIINGACQRKCDTPTCNNGACTNVQSYLGCASNLCPASSSSSSSAANLPSSSTGPGNSSNPTASSASSIQCTTDADCPDSPCNSCYWYQGVGAQFCRQDCTNNYCASDGICRASGTISGTCTSPTGCPSSPPSSASNTSGISSIASSCPFNAECCTAVDCGYFSSLPTCTQCNPQTCTQECYYQQVSCTNHVCINPPIITQSCTGPVGCGFIPTSSASPSSTSTSASASASSALSDTEESSAASDDTESSSASSQSSSSSSAFCGDGNVDIVCPTASFWQRLLAFFGFTSPPVCSGEQCDDGNKVNNDSCTNSCNVAYCSDSIVQTALGEVCDDGNIGDDDGCTYSCQLEFCGDSVLQPGIGEVCDSGPYNNDDPNSTMPCRTSCQPKRCGDGIVDIGLAEYCDGSPGCPVDCTSPKCGDATVNPELSEQCDNGTNNSDSEAFACRTNCALPRCGDGIVDGIPNAMGEECDDGNNSNQDGCSATCTIEIASCPPSICNLAGNAFCAQNNQTCSLLENEPCMECVPKGSSSSSSPSNSSSSSRAPVCTGQECKEAGGIFCAFNGMDCRTLTSGQCFECVPPSSSSRSFSSAVSSYPPVSCRVDSECGRTLCTPCSNGTQSCTVPVCDSGRCAQRTETRACNISSGSSSSRSIALHAACVGNSCMVVEGEGENECVFGLGCGTTTHAVCDSNMCAFMAGPGPNTCIPNEPCPIAMHAECRNNACVEVAGQGATTCSTNADCQPSSSSSATSGSSTSGNPGFCGDGVRNNTEQCDDGALNSNTVANSCRTNCTLPQCGDGIQDSLYGESCDDGNRINTDSCTFTCAPASCGDGNLQVGQGEECDDGNVTPNDGCSRVCLSEMCGDGMIQSKFGEQCDNGGICTNDQNRRCRTSADCSAVGGACMYDTTDLSCTSLCKLPGGSSSSISNGSAASSLGSLFCGNGSVETGEECDDANRTAGDGCSAECSIEMRSYLCGNGNREPLEACDDGNLIPGDGCSPRCTPESLSLLCGNGVRESNEQCDSGNTNSDLLPNVCRPTCKLPTCGDYITDANETCDLGTYNGLPGIPCSSTCRPPNEVIPSASSAAADPALCGNRILNRGEECDDGNTNSFDGCTSACRAEQTLVAGAFLCGDGIAVPPEECDDANGRNLDGCSDVCQLETGFCGDDILQRALGEQCEPNLHDIHLGYACSPADCRFRSALCGDATVDAGEECDLGEANADTPGSLCRTTCSRSRCGDGIQDSVEQCDDGNRLTGDGCDRFCREERGAAPGGETIPFPSSSNPASSVPFGNIANIPGLNNQPVGWVTNPNNQPRVGGDTGPAALAIMAAGAGAGIAWMRRKRRD